MLTKLNHYNGLWHQADRICGSGCDNVDGMKRALKDYQSRFPGGFQHVEAWEVVGKHDKWAKVPLLGEEMRVRAKRESHRIRITIMTVHRVPNLIVPYPT
ncbi:hypothetical protein HanRHA438_Chr10g0465521 [Helianthus annuus]|nr:hypothetical protein HanRHA438_Chr10g0465521 [Helianthus annuus]